MAYLSKAGNPIAGFYVNHQKQCYTIMATKGNTGLNTMGTAAKRAKIVVIKTAWNSAITNALEQGCTRILEQHSASITTYTVPGAVELTFAVKYLAESAESTADAFIVLGCVIKGDTPHFEYVCQSVTQGITHLNVVLNRPVIFGVLTLLTEAQAWERLGGAHGHKGEEAALTALQMVSFTKRLVY